MAPSPESRELRLLLVTVGASLAVLVGLAQLRFPAPGAAPAAPQLLPLERLGPQAVYEDLVQAVARTEARVLPHIVARTREDGRPGLALRWNSTQAVAWTPRPERALGVDVVAVERNRGLLLVRHARASSPAALPEWTPEAAGPLYLAATEVGAAGPALRPVFVGRLKTVASSTWGSLLSITAASLEPGTFLFTLDGRLVGLVVPDAGAAGVLAGAPLRASVDAIVSDPSAAAWSGVRLGRVPTAEGGRGALLVLAVEPWSAWAEPLRAGDQIEAVGGATTTSLAETELALQAQPSPRLRVRRGGTVLRLTATAIAAHGLRLEADLRGTRVVFVQPDSPGARAGLREGDVLTALDGQAAPEPDQVLRRYRSAPRGARLLAIAGHGRDARAVVLEKP
ncbi:MAG: PDZ domain-containing protein [Vicinamibacteria bacterium]|nr:PDZ domain-containing protein [Vicinamibacteria bacterium]